MKKLVIVLAILLAGSTVFAMDPIPMEFGGVPGVWMPEEDFDWTLAQLTVHESCQARYDELYAISEANVVKLKAANIKGERLKASNWVAWGVGAVVAGVLTYFLVKAHLP